MTTLSPIYGTSTAVTINNSGSIASGACESGAALDLQPSGTWTIAPEDVELTIAFTQPNSAPTGQKAVNLWIAPSEDGTHYADNDQYSGSANNPTLQNPTNWYGPFVINARTNVVGYGVVPSLKALCGGKLPRKCGLILECQTGFTVTSAAITATPINYSNA